MQYEHCGKIILLFYIAILHIFSIEICPKKDIMMYLLRIKQCKICFLLLILKLISDICMNMCRMNEKEFSFFVQTLKQTSWKIREKLAYVYLLNKTSVNFKLKCKYFCFIFQL